MPAGNDAVRNPGYCSEGLDLQHVAGFRPFHRDGTGDHVRAVGIKIPRGAAVVRSDVDGVLQHSVPVHTVAAEEGERIPALVFQDSLMREGINRDGLA